MGEIVHALCLFEFSKKRFENPNLKSGQVSRTLVHRINYMGKNFSRLIFFLKRSILLPNKKAYFLPLESQNRSLCARLTNLASPPPSERASPSPSLFISLLLPRKGKKRSISGQSSFSPLLPPPSSASFPIPCIMERRRRRRRRGKDMRPFLSLHTVLQKYSAYIHQTTVFNNHKGNYAHLLERNLRQEQK